MVGAELLSQTCQGRQQTTGVRRSLELQAHLSDQLSPDVPLPLRVGPLLDEEGDHGLRVELPGAPSGAAVDDRKIGVPAQ